MSCGDATQYHQYSLERAGPVASHSANTRRFQCDQNRLPKKKCEGSTVCVGKLVKHVREQPLVKHATRNKGCYEGKQGRPSQASDRLVHSTFQRIVDHEIPSFRPEVQKRDTKLCSDFKTVRTAIHFIFRRTRTQMHFAQTSRGYRICVHSSGPNQENALSS